MRLLFQHIKTHDSELRGQEEAVLDERGSYLHIAQNLTGTVNKLPRKLSLRFRWPSMFLLYRIDTPMIEEIGTTNPENQPLQIL